MTVKNFRTLPAWIPVAMSVSALGLVLTHIAVSGTAPLADEGAEAHFWQLLMAGQIPFVIYYAVKWLPRAPRPALLMLGVQLLAAVAAFLPVYLLRW